MKLQADKELTEIEMQRFRSWWFGTIVAVCLFLLLMTFITWSDFFIDAIPFDIQFLWKFNLGIEGNFAALWSGVLLFLPALHAFDGWSEHRSSQPALARAWVSIGLVLMALSFDEIASLHERLPEETGADSWWAFLPIALIFASMLAYGMRILYRFDRYRRTVWFIGLAFALFASVAVQERIEHRVDWPSSLVGLRAVIEEGTELLATLILIKVVMNNTRGLLSVVGVRDFPVFEALTAWRSQILLAGMVGIPIVAYYPVVSVVDEEGLGIPSDWPTAMLFFMAALTAIRPFLVSGDRGTWHGWVLIMTCLVGCASTVVGTTSPDILPIMALVIAVTSGVWAMNPAVTSRRYVPAMTLSAVLLLTAWNFNEREFVVALAVSYIALSIYYVNSSSPSQADLASARLSP